MTYYRTRSTQRVQTSLVEADHYSHMPTVKCLGGEKLTPPPPSPPLNNNNKKKVLDHYLHHNLVMLPLLWCFLAHLLILEYSDHHQNLISSSLYYPGQLHKISLQSIHNVLNTVVHRQTNKQRNTSQRYQKHNLLCQGGNYSKQLGFKTTAVNFIYLYITEFIYSVLPGGTMMRIPDNTSLSGSNTSFLLLRPTQRALKSSPCHVGNCEYAIHKAFSSHLEKVTLCNESLKVL